METKWIIQIVQLLVLLCSCESQSEFVKSNLAATDFHPAIVTDGTATRSSTDLHLNTIGMSEGPSVSRNNIPKSCPAEQGQSSGTVRVIWPKVTRTNSTPISSTPQCLDDNHYLLTRTCNSHGQWIPSKMPKCRHTLKFDTGECPAGFELFRPSATLAPLCLRLTEPQSWNYYQTTKFTDSLTIDDLPIEYDLFVLQWLSLLRTGVWMPARMLWHDNIMRWIQPIRYGEAVFSHILLNNGTGKCLLVSIDNGSYIGMPEHCKAHHPLLSIYYDSGNSLTHHNCPTGWQASRLSDDEMCYSIAKTSTPLQLDTDSNMQDMCAKGEIFTASSPQRTQIFQAIAHSIVSAKDRCIFRPKQSILLPVTVARWASFSTNSLYVNWDNDWLQTRTENSTIMLHGASGKWLFSESFTCVACELRLAAIIPNARLELEFDQLQNQLTLTIVNEHSLWRSESVQPAIRCFVHKTDDNTIASVNFILSLQLCAHCGSAVQRTQYSVLTTTHHFYHGTYWCIGFDRIHGKAIASPAISVYFSKIDIFAVLLSTSRSLLICNRKCLENIFLNDFMQRDHIDLTLYEARLVQIEFRQHQLLLVFHISVSLNASFTSAEPNNLNMTDSDMLRVYFEHKILTKLLIALTERNTFELVAVRSVEYCLPHSISLLNELNWWAIPVGQVRSSLEHFVCIKGMPALRACQPNRLEGGTWFINIEYERNCEPVAEHTERLINLSDNYTKVEQTSEIVRNLSYMLRSEASTRLPIDVYYVSEIMNRVVELETPITLFQIRAFSDIYNNIMLTDDRVLRWSSLANTTNRLLNVWDHFSQFLTNVTLPSNGLLVIRRQRLIMAIIDTTKQNITGIGLFNFSVRDAENMNALTVRFLSKHQDPLKLLSDNDLEIASYVSADLLDQLMAMYGSIPLLVITVFGDDLLFQAARNRDGIRPRADRMVISITIPGLSTHRLPRPISTFFRVSHDRQINACRFWNYTFPIGWSTEGLHQVAHRKRNVQCEATHLTHFGYLLHHTFKLEAKDKLALDIITMVGCSLSLAGTAGIFVSALTFRQWRAKLSTKFLLQFSAAIAIQITLFGLVQTELNLFLNNSEQPIGCIVIGALLHYVLLVVFAWKLIIAYMQFMRYVVVFKTVGTNRWLLKASLLGWCLPVFPVLIVLLVNPKFYVPDLKSNRNKFCYPRSYALYFGLLLPIAIVIVANLVVFIWVLSSFACTVKLSTVPNSSSVSKIDRATTLAQLRLSVFLFFLLGLTWFFGFLAFSSETVVAFSYLFCITATVQGFVLFLYFVVLDPVVRNLWCSLFYRWIYGQPRITK